MDTLSYDDLSQRMERIHGRYMLHFADKARITRDPDILTELHEHVVNLRSDCDRLTTGHPDLAALKAKADERRDLYQRELGLVRDAQAQGPEIIEAARLRAAADGIRHVYQRNFAGHPRGTRDCRLLGDIARQMAGIQKALFSLYQSYPSVEGLGTTLESVNGWVELYRNETQLVTEAYGAGTPHDRFGMLANRANG